LNISEPATGLLLACSNSVSLVKLDLIHGCRPISQANGLFC
jgi:hypothetical protein